MTHFGKHVPPLGLIVLGLLGIALFSLPQHACALTPYVVGRFSPETGAITDAAMFGDKVVLLYPEAGRIAEYTTSGKLTRHILREAGAEKLFRPTYCMAATDGGLLAFDEAEHKLFAISPDGNFSSGIDLAYPAPSGAVALSRINGLAYAGTGDIAALLGDRGSLASFNWDGIMTSELDLAQGMPYRNAVYARPQLRSDGSLYVLEYQQGAVLYRKAGEDAFRRLRFETPDGLDSAPLLQDFAVDNDGNVLVVTAEQPPRVQMLTPDKQGHRARVLDLELPSGISRIACRHSMGKFILWARDTPSVIVLELR